MPRLVFPAVLVICGAMLIGCHHDQQPAKEEKEKLPNELAVAGSEVAQEKEKLPNELAITGSEVARVHATGVQVYVWRAASNSWRGSGPVATFSGSGLTGKHTAGPAWACDDGSTVAGRVVAETPSPDPTTIPWQLLRATRHSGNGKFSDVTYIQRIKTVGGKAPSAPGAKDGDISRVDYAADFIFYGPGATTRP